MNLSQTFNFKIFTKIIVFMLRTSEIHRFFQKFLNKVSGELLLKKDSFRILKTKYCFSLFPEPCICIKLLNYIKYLLQTMYRVNFALYNRQ